MPKLEWNAVGTRFYEVGVDQGVLYIDGQPGVPWNGLTSVSENPSGGDANAYYIDGYKFSNESKTEEFQATLTAYTYPEEFGECDGTHQPRIGLFITQQRRKSFGLSYRTKIGNDMSPDAGYKLHLVYNALAAPASHDHSTINDSIDPDDFSWSITTQPPSISGYRPMAHVVVDSRYTDPSIMSSLENALYGTETDTAYLPDFNELIAIFDSISTLTVIDNGDGTWTATAPADTIRMLDDTTFEITASTAVFIDNVSYTLSSQ